MEKKTTPKGKSYWDETGAYQKEYDEKWAQLVPAQGECSTVHGEMVRAVSRLLYEFCNNGNCNAIDVETEWEECEHCDGTGYQKEECQFCEGDGELEDEEGDMDMCEDCDGNGEVDQDCEYCGGECGTETETNPEIVGYYKDLIDFLSNNMEDTSFVDKLIDFMKDPSRGYSEYKYDDYEMSIYNDLIDEVMHQILTTEDRSRIPA
jgi:RecJ-like exonuclease